MSIAKASLKAGTNRRHQLQTEPEDQLPLFSAVSQGSEGSSRAALAVEVYEAALDALQEKLGADRAQAMAALQEAQDIAAETSAAGESQPPATEVTLQEQVAKRRRAERYIRRQAHTTKALVRTASRLNAQLDLEMVLAAVCEETALALELPFASVSLYDPETRAFHLAGSYGLPDDFCRSARPLPRQLYDSYLEQYGSPMVVPDVQELTDLPNRDWYTGLDIHTTLSAGMMRDNELIGQLNVASREVRRFRKQELALVQGLADQGALAIANAREVRERKKAEEALVAEKQRLELLYDLSQNLAITLNPREVGNRALAGIMTFSGAQRGEMFMLDGAGEPTPGERPTGQRDHRRLRLVAVSGYAREARPLLDARSEVRIGTGLPGHVAQTRTAVIASDVRQHEAWLPVAELDDDVASASAVPLIAAGELIGVLMLLSDRPHFFSAEHVMMLEAAAKPIALSLQNARLYDAEYQARQVADRLRVANLALSEPLDSRTLLETLLDQLNSLLSYDSAAVLLFDSEGSLIRRAVRDHRQPAAPPGETEPQLELNREVDLKRAPALAGLLATQRSLLLADTTGCPAWNSAADLYRGGSCLAVPLMVNGNCIGAFTLAKAEPHFFTATHLRLVEAMAAQAAIAIHNAQRYDQAFAGREQLRGLTHQVVTAQEDERHRISYQLHDEAGQALSALQINLSLIRDDVAADEPRLRQRIDDAIDLTAGTIQYIRALADKLHPPALNVVGLNLTLHNLCRNFAVGSDLSVKYRGDDLPPLSESYRIVFYRFLQEGLDNVLKHAQARKVAVTLHYDGRQISLTVADDGRGFDPQTSKGSSGEPGNIGLFGLQERFARLGGQLIIQSQPGEGACLTARVPWQETV